MASRFKKIILACIVGAALVAGVGYYYYTTQEVAGIFSYRPARDKQTILDLFKKNWYWLVSEYTKDFSPEFMLDHRAYDKTPRSFGKEQIKVMLVDGKPVGFVAYHKKKFYQGFIHFLAVKEDMRGKGIGKKLIKYAIDDLARQGVKYIQLITRTTNYPAQKIYRDVGFKETSRDDKFVDFQITL